MLKRFSVLGLAVMLASTAAQAQDIKPEDFSKLMDSYLSDDANIDKVGNALERHFKQKRLKQQQNAQKAEEAKLEEQFKNPVDIDVSSSYLKGPEDAKVLIVEFSDFQCPFCKKGMDVMDQVAKEYPNDVKIAFKHLPIPFHPESKPAARAAMAAGKQGKFWEMHDELFNNQAKLGADLYPALAKKLGLDVDKFKTDFESAEIAKVVDDDAALAAKLGVRGTPGFFVNGVQVRGAQPLPKFKELVDRWLAKK